jgi:hypothetical protein
MRNTTTTTITGKAVELGAAIWGEEDSYRRAFLSPLYYNPDLKNWATNNKTKIQKIRGGMLGVNMVGIVASHTWFFRSSFSITPKDKIDKIDGVILTQNRLDKLNEDKLSEIGGGKYQDYYNYFKDYNDLEGLHLKTFDALTDKSFTSEIAALKEYDPTLGNAIEKTINDERDKIYASRVAEFKKVNETYDPENFKNDEGYAFLDSDKYNQFLIDHYRKQNESLNIAIILYMQVKKMYL